jgi:hypothetical protein
MLAAELLMSHGDGSRIGRLLQERQHGLREKTQLDNIDREVFQKLGPLDGRNGDYTIHRVKGRQTCGDLQSELIVNEGGVVIGKRANHSAEKSSRIYDKDLGKAASGYLIKVARDQDAKQPRISNSIHSQRITIRPS